MAKGQLKQLVEEFKAMYMPPYNGSLRAVNYVQIYSNGWLVRKYILASGSLDMLRKWIEYLREIGNEIYVAVRYVSFLDKYCLELSREPEEYRVFIAPDTMTIWLPREGINRRLANVFLHYLTVYAGYKCSKWQKVAKAEKYVKTKQAKLEADSNE